MSVQGLQKSRLMLTVQTYQVRSRLSQCFKFGEPPYGHVQQAFDVFKAVAPVLAVRRCYLTLRLAESQRHGTGPSRNILINYVMRT